jgi:hypothetical protein
MACAQENATFTETVKPEGNPTMSDSGELTPEERAMYAALDEQLDEQQAALERVRDEDTLGFIAFGDRPGWIDSRLSRKPLK